MLCSPPAWADALQQIEGEIVIVLPAMESGTANTRSDLSKRLEEYWRGLYVSKSIPRYDEFDLLEIPELIPHIVICTFYPKAKSPLEIKLAGSEIRVRTKLDVTGMLADELYGSEHTELLRASADVMIKTPCGVHQFNHLQQMDAGNTIIEVTGFPLSSHEKGKNYIILLVNWVGFSLAEPIEVPIRIATSQSYEWIDVGSGVPDF